MRKGIYFMASAVVLCSCSDTIPEYPDPIFGENEAEVNSLKKVRNFL